MTYACLYINKDNKLATRLIRENFACRRDELENELKRACGALNEPGKVWVSTYHDNDVAAWWEVGRNKQQGAVDETVWDFSNAA